MRLSQSSDPFGGRCQRGLLLLLVLGVIIRAGYFAEHARTTMKDIDLNVATGTDDILFYRESALPSLDNLPQLGPKFQQAYQEISAQQNFTPHSREDVFEWQFIVECKK